MIKNPTVNTSSTHKLNGAKVLFAGNSFTYYGNCVINRDGRPTSDEGYFTKVAKSFADSVNVTNFTFGSAGFSDGRSNKAEDGLNGKSYGIYQLMSGLHPDFYGNSAGNPVESFYVQDFVLLQQRGSNLASTYSDAKKIVALFPPETKFFFLLTSHDISKNHTNNINAAKELAFHDGFGIINWGSVVYDIWTHGIAASSLLYDKFSFIVNRSMKDGYHPNYLTGYITALMTYCALTGQSAVSADYSFVSDDMTYYTNGQSNYDRILSSEYDMKELQKKIDLALK